MKEDIKLGVSLYSYQEAIWRGNLDLEGALTAVRGCGATGVEIFGETLIPSFPFVSDEFLDTWFRLLHDLRLEPVCYEHFADRRFWRDPDRYLSDDDLFEVTMQYLRSAQKLGCKLIRLSHDGHNGNWGGHIPSMTTINAETFARLLPYAEETGVKMALEVHAPGLLEDGGNDDFLDAIEKTGCYDGGGLMLDLSGCFRDMSPMEEDAYVRRGAKREIVQYLRQMSRKAYTFDGNNDVDWDEVAARIREMGAGPIEENLLTGADFFGMNALNHRAISTPDTVRAYAPQLCYVHGKLYWIDEDLTCDELDYPRYIRALAEGGYKGYISTELEGQRSVPHTLNEVVLVKRQQTLMRRCLAEC